MPQNVSTHVMKKKIVLAGGTGFIGTGIITHFGLKDYQFVILTRNPKRREDDVKEVKWDAKTPGAWTKELEDAEAIINLTGRSINCRYTEENKQEILDSRTQSTAVLGKAILKLQHPPKVWINASSAAIYGSDDDRDMDEFTGDIGTGFLADVVRAWERAFYKSDLPATQRFVLRITIVLGKGEGVIPRLENLVRFGLGGKQGSGGQYISWIHEEDFYRIMAWCINNPEKQGVYNCCAPKPVTNAVLMRALRKIMHRPVGLPAFEWMVKIGAFIIGTEPDLLLKSMRVVPTRLLQQGFVFNYPDLDSALKNLLSAENGLK